VLANGAERPDLIPDNLALAHFILSVAVPDKPSPGEMARRASILEAVQLPKSDLAQLLAALKGVHAQLAFLSRETSRIATEADISAPRLDDLRVGRTRVLDETITRVRASLSPAGVTRLDAFMKASVKRNIVICGDQAQ
jgi:hypothetical protein